jgi:hypothetical protein
MVGKQGVARDFALKERRRETLRPKRYAIIVEGSDAGAGVTSIELAHGGVSTHDLGIPIPNAVRVDSVSVSFSATGSPLGDSWTLTLEVRQPNSAVFEDAATLEVNN